MRVCHLWTSRFDKNLPPQPERPNRNLPIVPGQLLKIPQLRQNYASILELTWLHELTLLLIKRKLKRQDGLDSVGNQLTLLPIKRKFTVRETGYPHRSSQINTASPPLCRNRSRRCWWVSVPPSTATVPNVKSPSRLHGELAEESTNFVIRICVRRRSTTTARCKPIALHRR